MMNKERTKRRQQHQVVWDGWQKSTRDAEGMRVVVRKRRQISDKLEHAERAGEEEIHQLGWARL